MTILQPIPQPQVHNYLEVIRPGIERIHELSDGRLSVDSMKHKLLGGYWLLWIALTDGKSSGFLATEYERRDNGDWVHIPLAYAPPGHEASLWEGVESLKAYAVSLGARGLEFESSRRGWDLLGKTMAFEWASSRYRLEIAYD